MGFKQQTPFTPIPHDQIRISFNELEQDILAQMISEMRQLLMSPSDARLRRLYPCAYTQDSDSEQEYQRLMHGDLASSQLHALDTVEKFLEESSVTKDDLDQWIRGVNSIRLVLGTALDVHEEQVIAEDNPDAPAYAVYDFLSMLLEQALQALTEPPQKKRFFR